MRRIIAPLVAALALSATGAAAQVAWDAPLLVPPGAPNGVGIFLTEPAGGDIGLTGMLRPFRIGGQTGLGLWGGVAENEDDDLSFFAGADLTGTVLRRGDDVPVDLDWIVGAGAGFGEEGVIVSVPAGVTIGRTFTFEDNTFTPFLVPKFVLDVFLGDEEELESFDDDVDLSAAVDLGVDARLRQNWLIRFGTSLSDDRDAIAIGIVLLR